ncbi:hypothetical protein IL306_011697 [Fusarium sp. DS 682]|nr:hypothetical protein IL306_011697 [Fusarium sp. DS 682]
MSLKAFRWLVQAELLIVLATSLIQAHQSNEGLQHILYPQEQDPLIVTGQYYPARITIHDTSGRASWSWSKSDFLEQQIPQKLKDCLSEGGSVTDAKWANHGRSVVSIYGYAAVVINHCPEDPSKDKAITFGMCLNSRGLQGTHGVEIVPDGKLAIATTSYESTGNIKIVNTSLGTADPNPKFLQELDGIPASHSLVWDQVTSSLWVVGNDKPPQAKEPSRAQLNRYLYRDGLFSQKPSQVEIIGPPARLDVEWDSSWWDGGHDITPVPNQRQLLISTDLDMHLFNLTSASFLHGTDVLNQTFLKGFKPVTSHEHNLPRADIKSLSLHMSSGTLYVQAVWQKYFSTFVNHLPGGSKPLEKITFSQSIYRSRWFSAVAGWDSAH